MDRTLLEYNPELSVFESGEFQASELRGPAKGAQRVFSENQEMEFGAMLLEVTNEAELNHFLGSLIGQAGHAVGRFVRPSTGQALVTILKNTVIKALPMVERVLRGPRGMRSRVQLGGQSTSAAGHIFGLELEGLSSEDKEFEVAKSFVRFAGAAVGNAINAPVTVAAPEVAKKATALAAQRHAPGLLRYGWGAPKQTGRWYQRGRSIIVNL